jgi:hypothetical protein
MQRNVVRGPALRNLDLAVTRNFPLSGSQAIEVRVEAFNALNWLELMAPSAANLSLNSATFGQISQGYPPRIMQLAVKYAF